jgi:hypothetical protein
MMDVEINIAQKRIDEIRTILYQMMKNNMLSSNEVDIARSSLVDVETIILTGRNRYDLTH